MDLAGARVTNVASWRTVSRSLASWPRAWRDGVRFLRRAPGLSLAVIMLMAVSIGAAVAVFSVANSMLMQPLPFRDAGRIVMIWEARPERHATRNVVSGHEFPEWRNRARVFDAMAAMAFSGTNVTLTGAGEPAAVSGVKVSSGFFDVMGVAPLLGRTFTSDEDTPGQGRVVILSHGLWKERFAGDRQVVGRAARLDDQPHQIVGVMPAGFEFPRGPAGDPVDYWAPIAEPIHLYRGRHYLQVVARLKNGVSTGAAEADMLRVSRDLAAAMPDLNRGHETRVIGLRDEMVKTARPALVLLASAVGSLLLIGCGNVAGLLLVRGLARQSEVAVRLALGASRANIAKQFLSESVLLGLCGGLLGLAGAYWLTRIAAVLIPAGLMPTGDVTMDLRVVAFAMGTAAGAGLLFGVAPALQVRRVALAGALTQAGRSAVAQHTRLRGALVAGQLALTIVLVSCTAVLFRGLDRLAHVDPGFTTENVLVADLALPAARYGTPVRQRQFTEDLTRSIAALPGVVSTATTNTVPLGAAYSSVAVDVEGRATEKGEELTPRYRVVSTDYFKALRINVVSGRDFESTDARVALPLLRWFAQQPLPAGSDLPQAAPVAVISEQMAHAYWPGLDPVGRRFRALFSPWITVVGVVADTRTISLREPPAPEFYLSNLQEPQGVLSVIVRSDQDVAALAAGLRRAIASIDPSLAISSTATMEERVSSAFALPRFTSGVIATFATIALLLMASGVYALVAFTTSQRAPEIALRAALGAARARLLRLVLAGTLPVAAAGIGFGTAIALPLTRILDRELVGMGIGDPFTWFAVVAIVLATVVAGCWWPVRRAVRTDPAAVLRRS